MVLAVGPLVPVAVWHTHAGYASIAVGGHKYAARSYRACRLLLQQYERR